MGRLGYNNVGNCNNSEEEHLAGVYNANQRRKEVNSRLEAAFDKIRVMDLSKDSDEGSGFMGGFLGGRGRGRRASQPEDLILMSLMSLEAEISQLGKEVKQYEGPHFTKAYRTHQGLCSKLQTDLDALDVTGNEDLRKRRKTALMDIDGLAKQLASKAHPDGKSCHDCEVKN